MLNTPCSNHALIKEIKQCNVLFYLFLDRESMCEYSRLAIHKGALLLADCIQFLEVINDHTFRERKDCCLKTITEIQAALMMVYELKLINDGVYNVLNNRMVELAKNINKSENDISSK